MIEDVEDAHAVMNEDVGRWGHFMGIPLYNLVNRGNRITSASLF